MTLFHRAAREGYVDLLREATRKDLNLPDEDGVTPTLLAAACGNLEALRMIVGRGGDPDKCDYIGNSALHWAAGNGHINCVSFLVNFGVNLWTLDNSMYTAKEIAGIKGHQDVLNFLDREAGKRSTQNKKYAQGLKEKATKDAEKRIKKYKKLQEKFRRKAARDDKKMQTKVEQTMTAEDEPVPSALARPSISIPIPGWHKDSTTIYPQQPTFSDWVNSQNGTATKKTSTGVARKVGLQKKQATTTSSNGDFTVRETDSKGKHSVRSIKGVRRDSDVLLVPKQDTQNGFQRQHIEGVFIDPGHLNSGNNAEEVLGHEPSSIFDRAGFGNLTFRHPSISGTLQSIPQDLAMGNGVHEDDEDSAHASGQGYEGHNGHGDDSIGSAGSLVRRHGKSFPWPNYITDNDYQDDAALETFLTAHDLVQCLLYLRREKIDLKALLLLDEKDLQELGIPMGIRKKLLEAIGRRKEVLVDVRDVYDSRL